MDDPRVPLLALALLVLALGWYLSFSASRLDRLHHKVEAARGALDVQLVRRSAAAIEAAAHLDPATALLVTDSATAAMAIGEEADTDAARAARDPLDVPPRLEVVENDLSRALHLAFDAPPEGTDPFAGDSMRVLAHSCHRVHLARRFHNDAVAQAQRFRRKRVVHWARLAGRAPLPQMIEFDDTMPAGLAPLL